jgi:calcineurin-like phosphoesterase family protein
MIWFASDHHFGHSALLTFRQDDGSPARPGFRDVDHMNETMIANHNRVVGPTDRVYFLGDVGFSKVTLTAVLPRLNGKKRLILGNHDYSDRQMMRFYLEHFQKIMSWRHFTEPDCALICTHYPLHEASFLGRYAGSCINVHGHIHARRIDDERYINICVEQINYTPVSYDWLLAKARKTVSQDRC